MIINAYSETGQRVHKNFDPSIDASGFTKISLLRCSLYNGWYNINTENNVLRYWIKGNGIWKDKIIRPGNYNIDTLNSALKLGDRIKIKKIEATGHSYILLQDDSKIDFTHPRNFASLLGFDEEILTSNRMSARRANFFTVSEYRIHCNLIDTSKTRLAPIGSDTARPSDCLEILPLRENLTLSERVVYENKNFMLPMPLRKNENISSIEIWITDQYDKPINFNGSPFSFIIELS